MLIEIFAILITVTNTYLRCGKSVEQRIDGGVDWKSEHGHPYGEISRQVVSLFYDGLDTNYDDRQPGGTVGEDDEQHSLVERCFTTGVGRAGLHLPSVDEYYEVRHHDKNKESQV